MLTPSAAGAPINSRRATCLSSRTPITPAALPLSAIFFHNFLLHPRPPARLAARPPPASIRLPAPPSLAPTTTEKGVLLYLQWYDLKCNDCGGPDSEYCINSVSCTLPFDDCKPTNETIGLDDPTLDACATGITVAFAGSDSKGKAFASGSNVKRLNAYSLAELYVDGKERLSSPGKFGGA